MGKEKSAAKTASSAARHNLINRPPSGPQFFPPTFDDQLQDMVRQPPTPSLTTVIAPLPPPDPAQMDPLLGDPNSTPTPNRTPLPVDHIDHSSNNPPPATHTPQPKTKAPPATPLPMPTSNLSDKDLLQSFLAVKEANRRMVTNAPNIFKSKLAKFTPVPEQGFPTIHLASPGQPIEDLSGYTLQEWIKVDTPKLLARVFDYDGSDPMRMNPIITCRIKTMVEEISTALNARETSCIVSPPSPIAGYPIESCPNAFLIHNIAEETRDTMLNQRIWSTANITFEARPLVERTLPSLLANLVGFTTNHTQPVREAVQETWRSLPIKYQIANILRENNPFFRQETTLPLLESYVDAFIDSVETELLDYKAAGGVANPPLQHPCRITYRDCPYLDHPTTICSHTLLPILPLRSWLGSPSLFMLHLPFGLPPTWTMPIPQCPTLERPTGRRKIIREQGQSRPEDQET
ncbi:hypothetical protein J3R83DRAFT_4942 [Lanmaoa asiatica]|nr:hypothetical protein J3R83DRAFT_4942 [Lanmaoa asiatica]